MSIILRYDKYLYEEKINELQGCLTKLESHRSELERLKNEISKFWNDDAGQKVHLIMDTHVRHITSIQRQCQDQITFYKNAIAKFDATKEVTDALLETALKIVVGL